MIKKSFTEQKFNKITAEDLAKGDYENCEFTECNFNDQDISGIRFSDCRFIKCDLSLAKINETAFNEASFTDCKLLGLHFDECDQLLISMEFENCQLDLASFYKLDLRKKKFSDCSLKEADFTLANLSGASFENCNLERTVFSKTDLVKADLRTSYNYSFDPDENYIKKAKFSAPGVFGLLDKYDITIE